MPASAANPDDSSLPFGQASLSLATAIRDGDLDAAQGHFAPDACLVTPDATAVYGAAEIRGILAQLIEAGAVIEVETGSLVRVGGLALGSERLHFRSRGVPQRQSFPASTVLRRHGDDWRIAIAAPWGWGHAACRCAESVRDMRRPGFPHR
ncbi:MAG: nuclear transport factor 2 family protein [Solirubrobacterales bacterium]